MSLQLNQTLTAIVKEQYMYVSDILSSVPKEIKSLNIKYKNKSFYQPIRAILPLKNKV